MDGFVECWEGLEDPRTGNAALHGFYGFRQASGQRRGLLAGLRGCW